MKLPRRTALAALASAADAAFGWGPAWSAAMSFEAFRQEILEVARRRFPDLPLAEGAEDEELVSGPLRLYLGNLYRSVRDLPAERREARIVEWFGQFRKDVERREDAREAAADVWAHAQPLLRPKLVPLGYVTQYPTLVHRPCSARLVIAYGVDLGVKDAFVLEAKLAKWGVPAGAVHEAAIANLEAMSADVALQPSEAGPFLSVNKGDAYDASRILLPNLRARILAALGGAAFAGIPNRDFFIAWSKGLSAQDTFIAQVRADSRSEPYPLTDEIFALGADGMHVATKEELG